MWRKKKAQEEAWRNSLGFTDQIERDEQVSQDYILRQLSQSDEFKNLLKKWHVMAHTSEQQDDDDDDLGNVYWG